MSAVLHSRVSPFRVKATPRRIGLAVVLAMHGVLLAALLSYSPARTALLAAAPIMVEFIVPPPVEKPALPPTELPKPKPVAKPAVKTLPKPVAKPIERTVQPPPILSAPAEAPSTAVTAAPAAPPAPVAVVAPPGPAEAAPAVAVTPPIFNADYLDNPSPAYPPVSRRSGEQGRVLLRVLVGANGTAQDIQVRTSSGFARLDESARDTVMRWKFVPAKRGPEPVSAWVLIPISFRLEG